MSKLQLEYPRGEVLAGKYEVLERLEQGPLGVTYRVQASQGGKTLRLLLLDPAVAGKDEKDAIIEAVKVARGLSEPHLLKVGELGQHNGVAYVTTEDFSAPTLRSFLAERRSAGEPLQFREAAQITIQILEACRAVHEAGQTFRGLRPEHILVASRRTGPGGKNLVADVRVLHAGLWNLVPTGALAEDEFNRGETQYVAPELKSFNPKTGPRADLYSVGVIFYELLVNAPPVGSYQLPRSRRPELPPLADPICQKALSSAPEDRYATARELIVALQSAAVVKTDDGTEELPATRGIHPAVWAVAVFALFALAYILLSGRTDPQEAAIAKDNALRNRVREQHAKPTTEEVNALLARHPANMMFIPEGKYVAGRLHQEKAVTESIAEVRDLPAYLIDIFEQPNLSGAPPKRGVSFAEAEKTCAAEGKQLCSAEQIEKACKGPSNLIYGYADAFNPETCGKGPADSHNAGALGECKSGWGVYDVAGNLREWTRTPKGDGRVIVKGGLPNAPENGSRCAFGTDVSVNFTDDTIGFRCCRDADAPAVPAKP